MKPKRIVLIGGPGSGKTTLIKALEKDGHTCFPEISREVILEAQKEGVEQLFLTNPLLFSQKLLKSRLHQFNEAKKHNTPFLFYDRGLPDVIAYLKFSGTEIPYNFTEICSKNTYDSVFILPPWEAIYKQDNERYESFEQAEKLYTYLKNEYEIFGHQVIEVPLDSIKNRIKFITHQLLEIY